jgi:integrase
MFRAKGPRAAGTINSYPITLSALFSWAQRRRLTPRGWQNPCHSVPLRQVRNEVVRFLDATEQTALLAACRKSKWPRLYLLVLMALTTGARRGELLGLRWRDIDFDAGTAALARTKNNDRRLLVLTPAVVEELRRFKAAPGSLVFASKRRPDRAMTIEHPWMLALKAAGIKAFRFHDLRHSCASGLARSGATLLEIADTLGHRSLQVTKRYSHLCTDSRRKLIGRVWGDTR